MARKKDSHNLPVVTLPKDMVFGKNYDNILKHNGPEEALDAEPLRQKWDMVIKMRQQDTVSESPSAPSKPQEAIIAEGGTTHDICKVCKSLPPKMDLHCRH